MDFATKMDYELNMRFLAVQHKPLKGRISVQIFVLSASGIGTNDHVMVCLRHIKVKNDVLDFLLHKNAIRW